jgi:hypothetical protein
MKKLGNLFLHAANSVALVIVFSGSSWANSAESLSPPGPDNSIPAAMDAKTDKISSDAKQALSDDASRLKSSLLRAKNLVSELKVTSDQIDRDQISRQVSTAVHEVSLEKGEMETRAQAHPSVLQSSDYKDLITDVENVESDAKRLPDSQGEIDLALSDSLLDLKRFS